MSKRMGIASLRMLILVIALISLAAAYSTVVGLDDVNRVGGTDTVRVSKYYIRVVRVSLGVSGDMFYNEITSITIEVSSPMAGRYNVYATVTSGRCSASASWTNVYLSPTPITLSSTLTPRCDYLPPGATVEVRGSPA